MQKIESARAAQGCPGRQGGRDAGKRSLCDAFAVECDVQAFAFLLFVDAKADHGIDDFEKNKRCHGAINDCGNDSVDLSADLADISFEGAWRTTNCFGGEHAGQDRAGNAAEIVNCEDIE